MAIPLRQISRDISDTYSDTLTFFVDMLFVILLVSDIYILLYSDILSCIPSDI